MSMVIDGIEVEEHSGDPGDPIAEFLLRIAEGDQAAFAGLYDALSSRMFGLILRVLVDRAQSEEVLQEVFLEIWQSASQYSPNKGQGRTWVLTMTHRRAVDRVRSAQSSVERDVRIGIRNVGVEFDGVAEDVELRWEGRRVVHALQQLPEKQKEALTLAYYGGYSQREISALTGTPIGTVKTRMRDGLSRLRSKMGVMA